MLHEALTWFGREAAVAESAFGPGESKMEPDGWRRITWTQTWFGESAVTRYTFDPSDRLTRIDYTTPDGPHTTAAIRAELGEPTKSGASPHFLNSSEYARWDTATFAVVLEDYAPGCEVGITASTR